MNLLCLAIPSSFFWRLYYDIAGRKLKLGKNFKKMVPIYRLFAEPWEHCLDFSDDMLHEMYLNESSGIGKCSPQNGFYHGKKWMNVTIAMWKEDFGRTLGWWELYEDNRYPHWWLDKVLGRREGRPVQEWLDNISKCGNSTDEERTDG